MKNLSALLVLFAVAASAVADEPPPLEAYGSLPEVSALALSPSGEVVAYRQTTAEEDIVLVIDIDRQEFLGAIDVGEVKPRYLYFVDEDSLLLVASETERSPRYRDPWERRAAFVYNFAIGDMRRPLLGEESVYPNQSVGRVVGRSPDGESIFMPAMRRDHLYRPEYSLFNVATEGTRQRVVGHGKRTTIDWFVGADGWPFIREDFDGRNERHRIYAVSETPYTLLYEAEVERPEINPLGLTADRSGLFYEARSPESDSYALFIMSTEDGAELGQVFRRDSQDINNALLDINRVLYGVEYEGFYPTYDFIDERLAERWAAIEAMLPGSSARLVSWSEDFRRLVVHASGSWTSGVYLLFTEGEEQPSVIARQRPRIERDAVAETLVVEYEARDGLTIPALITGYAEVIEGGNAPLIVLPHGGPASHDRAGFDWLPQFFASRGYVVLQPQFRGSTGFGRRHREAGNGEWGRKMQTDLDDGVAFAVAEGVADPDRVCIVGASYGGYAALAAAAFSPDLYKCHVSINGVTDIRRMLRDDRNRLGRNHWVVKYWEEWYGVEFRDREELDSLSPARLADSIVSPVLLVHGRDDTVVPPEQSRLMRNALRRTDGDVEFVQIRGEDHWLSSQETRIEVLRIVSEFIDEHL